MHLTQHLCLSYVLPWRLPLERRDRVLAALAGIAPDLDAPILLVMGKEAFVEYHHDVTHHLLGAAVVAGAAIWLGRRKAVTAGLASAAWLLHLLCDMLGAGERNDDGSWAYPLPLFWPFSSREFPPFDFSWPLASWQNAAVMAILLALVVRLAIMEGRTVVEVFSVRADRAVVAAIRGRFTRP